MRIPCFVQPNPIQPAGNVEVGFLFLLHWNFLTFSESWCRKEGTTLKLLVITIRQWFDHTSQWKWCTRKTLNLKKKFSTTLVTFQLFKNIGLECLVGRVGWSVADWQLANSWCQGKEWLMGREASALRRRRCDLDDNWFPSLPQPSPGLSKGRDINMKVEWRSSRGFKKEFQNSSCVWVFQSIARRYWGETDGDWNNLSLRCRRRSDFKFLSFVLQHIYLGETHRCSSLTGFKYSVYNKTHESIERCGWVRLWLSCW